MTPWKNKTLSNPFEPFEVAREEPVLPDPGAPKDEEIEPPKVKAPKVKRPKKVSKPFSKIARKKRKHFQGRK